MRSKFSSRHGEESKANAEQSAYNMTVSGTGSLSGAFIAKSIVISGGASAHNDESLNAGGHGGTDYSYASWFEDTR
jgi:hypothetical protein